MVAREGRGYGAGMKFDPERVIAALETLPREKRPYSIRDMCVRDVGLRDLLNDLRPFIEADIAKESAVARARQRLRDMGDRRDWQACDEAEAELDALLAGSAK